MVTASHNPPSDNAVKVYWSTGGQILPPHDKGVIERVMTVEKIERADFDQAVSEGQVVLCREDIDQAFISALQAEAFPGPRDLKVIYSPLHGVGASAVVPALRMDGFEDVEVFAEHAELSGDFPNVPNHVSNPENTAVFDSIIQRAQKVARISSWHRTQTAIGWVWPHLSHSIRPELGGLSTATRSGCCWPTTFWSSEKRLGRSHRITTWSRPWSPRT